MLEAPPNGESAAAFTQRVAAAFAHAVARHAELGGGTLAIVTHGLVIRALLAGHVQLADGVSPATHLGNTSLTIADSHPPHIVSLLNCTAHLGGAAADDARALSGG